MLRDALRTPATFAPPLELRPQLPEVARLLLDRQGDEEAKRRPAAEQAALLQRLRRVGFDWERVEAADRFAVAWVLWQGADPPAEHPAFLAAFLRWLDAPWRRVQATRLAASWAAAFDPERASTRFVADWLAARADALLPPWPGLAARFDVFSIRHGPAALADAFLASRADPAAFIAQLGLRRGLGLEVAVLAAAAVSAAAALAKRPYLADRLIELAHHVRAHEKDDPPPVDAAPIRTAHARLAETLLCSWPDGQPPEDLGADIVAYLLRERGDPRLGRSGWRGIDAAAVATMRSWLRRTTIAAFFAIGEPAAVGLAGSSWRTRRDFWLARAERLEPVWIVAGSRRRAQIVAGGLGCGRLLGCPPDQGVLLLRLNSVTIVETGRLGATYVWRPGNPLTPPLDPHLERLYTLASLTAGADFALRERPGDGPLRYEQLEAFVTLRTGLRAA